MLLKWPYYPKQSTDSMQIPVKMIHDIPHRTRTNNPKIHMEALNDPESTEQS